MSRQTNHLTHRATPLPWIRARRWMLALPIGAVVLLAAIVAGLATAPLLWLLGAPPMATLAGAVVCAVLTGVITAGFMRLLHDLELARLRQKERASRDGTTGVDTRRRFLAHAKREFARAVRYGQPMSLLWVGLDRFEALRTAQGDLNAERCLRAAVGLIRETVRVPDLVGRMSGPVFAVLLPHTDPLGALDVAERIRERIDAASPRIDGRLVKFSASIGVVALDARHASLTALLADVELALRQAQQVGGNVVRTAAFRSRPKSGASVTDGALSTLTVASLPFQDTTPKPTLDHKRNGAA